MWNALNWSRIQPANIHFSLSKNNVLFCETITVGYPGKLYIYRNVIAASIFGKFFLAKKPLKTFCNLTMRKYFSVIFKYLYQKVLGGPIYNIKRISSHRI